MADEYGAVERPALDSFETLGWDVIDQQRQSWTDPRESTTSAILEPRLRDAVQRINPWISENNLNKVVREIQQVAETSTIHVNEQIHELLIRHTAVEQDRGHGKKHQTVKFIDYENSENNDFLALNQFPVCGPHETIVSDVLPFVNGISLGSFSKIERTAPHTHPRTYL